MDHAGIATQMVVERQLAGEGIDRRSLGAGLHRACLVLEGESGGAIARQLRRLGASPDWSRERFTMAQGLSRAVIEVFVGLYRQGLVYRDKRLVNWDPVLGTAISDLEVEQREVKDGTLWHIRYPLAGRPGEHIVVATTRPETMLGDTAVAVHPEDERYRGLVGGHAALPLVGRLLPIVADDYAEPAQGSGAVKITPAHDFNEFEVGRRHDLEIVNLFDTGARLNDNAPEAYRGLDRFEARRRVLADLEAQGLIEKIEPHVHTVPHGDRSGAVDRAVADRPVVCRCQDPRRAGDRGGGVRPHPLRARAVGEHLFRVDAQHPALVHLAPALVGPPHPGMVWPRRPGLRRRLRGRGGRAGGAPLWPGRGADARCGRAGYLVQLGPLAVFHSRLARAPRRRWRPTTPTTT